MDGLGWLPEARVEALNKATHREGAARLPRMSWPLTSNTLRRVQAMCCAQNILRCAAPRNSRLRRNLQKAFDPLYEAVAKLLSDAGALTDERIGVFIYGTAVEFRAANAQREGTSWSGGFYRARTGLSHFPLYEGSAAAANHELTHAIIDYALRGKPISAYDGPRGKQSAAACFWIAEGVAMHFEGFDASKANTRP